MALGQVLLQCLSIIVSLGIFYTLFKIRAELNEARGAAKSEK